MNGTQPQGQYQVPYPQQQQQQPQQQHPAQQRPAANMQQPLQGQGQQKLQQQTHNPYANFDPQLALFTLEKPKNAKSWEDVEPEQLHVSLQAVQAELNKFKRNHGSVKREINQIPSANCRRLINELVEEKTKELMRYNKSLQFRIAAVETEWKDLNRRERQIKRVVVILETEPSGFQDPMQMKQAQGGAMKNQQHQQFQGQPNLQQQPKMNPPPQMQPMGQGQQHAQPMPGNVPPPPPPPPGQGGMPGQHGMPIPGPPAAPMMDGQGMMPNPNVHNMTPVNGMYPMGQGNMQGIDPRYYKAHKSRHRDRGRRDSSSEDEWESTSDSSSSEPIIIDNGEFGSEARRGRSRHPSKIKKVYRSRSRSKSHTRNRSGNRSRSRSLIRNVRVLNYSDKAGRRRRDSVIIDPPPFGRYSPRSSMPNSPKESRQDLPQVHVHVKNVQPESKKSHKINYATPMSRESSWGSASASGTASFTNSSTYTAEDPVFDVPLRSAMRSGRNHGRRQSWNQPQGPFQHPHPSQIYDLDVEHRPKFRHVHANDYPHQQRIRDSYFDNQGYNSRPGMMRRNSVAVTTTGNPFASAPYQQPVRTVPYAAEPGYTYPPQRTIAADPNTIQIDELAEALEHIQDSKRRIPLRRAYTDRPMYEGDEWDIRLPSTRRGVFPGYD